ncbi:MAG: hypothetical protein AAFO07_07775 [Bacteroidota bacterium]
MKLSLLKWSFLLFLLFSLNACQDEGQDQNLPDVSSIEVDLKVKRFEQELFDIDTNKVEQELLRLNEQYPEFGPIFFDAVLGASDPKNAPEGPATYIRGFLTYPGIRQLYDTCNIVFEDLSDVETQLSRSLQYYNYHFPDEETPDLTTFISEYSIGAFIYGNNSLAIGLDFFLGSDYPYQSIDPKNPNFSQYLTRSFNKDHIVPKAVRLLVEDKVGNTRGVSMLEQMIHNGKTLYIMDQLMPHVPDTAVFEFSAEQLEWITQNERGIWNFFIDQDLLYSVDAQKFRKYVSYSPNSPGMPDEAPGRTANWLGYMMIKQFMLRNPNTSFLDLIALDDAQQILERSKYKPPL